MELVERLRGVAVGAAVGDALGMPLEFGARIPANRLVREMESGRLAGGSFTDDTEMALALADSLLERFPLDAQNLTEHFVRWYRTNPPDIGIQTASVLRRQSAGEEWREAASAVLAIRPDSAGNGSVMRCWPVALAYHGDKQGLIAASELQSQVTHPHGECVAGSAFVNLAIYYLLEGVERRDAIERACAELTLQEGLRAAIVHAPGKKREELTNSGWVRHTVESAVWGLLTTDSFEEAVVQVANLGNDADTAAAVTGALAGAAYGLEAIPVRWRTALNGRWPLRNGTTWDVGRFEEVADRLAALCS